MIMIILMKYINEMINDIIIIIQYYVILLMCNIND